MFDSNFYYKFYYGWWKNIDKFILLLILSLFFLGLFFSLVSTSLIASDKLNTNTYYFFVKHFYSQSDQKISIEAFKEKYHFFNCSRQTRLLGRWVKLSGQFNQQFYLKFLTITNQRLINNLKNLSMESLKSFYNKLIPDLYVC